MAFFILKVEEETAEAAETKSEGITCSSMMPRWDEVKQGMQCLVEENPFLLSGSRSSVLCSVGLQGQSGLFTGVKHPVGTAQRQYWHCLELALNVQC